MRACSRVNQSSDQRLSTGRFRMLESAFKKGGTFMSTSVSLEDWKTWISAKALSVGYFMQPNCSVCHALLPKVKELVKELDVEMKVVNLKGSEEVFGQYQIFTTPVVIISVEGKEVERHARFVQMEKLRYDIIRYQEIFEE
ncbi:thioredoxin family protein [Jeotgalibacillus soli]|uniref:thioredoxin family protein n=1 Tax=Jeotgalibacillus soli TaxID=889306 RepID=UPI0030ECCF48